MWICMCRVWSKGLGNSQLRALAPCSYATASWRRTSSVTGSANRSALRSGRKSTLFREGFSLIQCGTDPSRAEQVVGRPRRPVPSARDHLFPGRPCPTSRLDRGSEEMPQGSTQWTSSSSPGKPTRVEGRAQCAQGILWVEA